MISTLVRRGFDGRDASVRCVRMTSYANLVQPMDLTGSASMSTAAAPWMAYSPIPSEPSTSGFVLEPAIAAIEALHTATGLPWWAAIAAVGVGVRSVMLPITLKGMQAGASTMQLLRQARQDTTHPSNPPNARAGGYLATAQRFQALRRQRNAPHPAWMVASPLIQLPVFITAMGAVRTLCLEPRPGLSSGGIAWFPDLTQCAVDFSSMTSPMGPPGIILPTAIALAMYANIDAAFSVGDARRGATAAVWILGKVRLLLEWAVVPLFVAALQLPHGALCYWAASSGYALLQHQALRLPAVRQTVGLHQLNQQTPAMKTAEHFEHPSVQPPTPEVAQLFLKAAELRAKNDFKGAETVLREILGASPGHPRALFALGQVLSGGRVWAGAAQAYLQAAQRESDAAQACRAWFGAGVALHQCERYDEAGEAFARAAQHSGADQQLRVRALVAGATLERRAGRRDAAIELLRKAAKIEKRVEEIYLKPLLEGESQGSRE